MNMLCRTFRRILGNGFRRSIQSPHRCIKLSPAMNAAQNVYKISDDCLAIKWNDGKVDEFPYVYLRENCRCSTCYTDERKLRTINLPKDVDLNITAQSATWNTANDQLDVHWEDGHTSQYSGYWLKYLRYRPADEGQPDGILRKNIKLWGSEMSDVENVPTFQFEKLLSDEEELFKWLVTVVTQTGIAKVENVPKEKDQIFKLSESVGYFLPTSHGVVPLVYISKDDSVHEIGYSESNLAPHTDYSFQESAPLIAMLHCIEQTKSEGGVNLFIDAFHAAKLLNDESPELFQLLATTPVEFGLASKTDIGKIHSRTRRPVIRLDYANKLEKVGYSEEYRNVHMPLEPRRMKSFYQAYCRFTELIHDERVSFWYKMKPGDLMVMNNYRVLHARSGFKDRGDNSRLLQQGFFDWDCVHSKIRVLAEKQGKPSPVD